AGGARVGERGDRLGRAAPRRVGGTVLLDRRPLGRCQVVAEPGRTAETVDQVAELGVDGGVLGRYRDRALAQLQAQFLEVPVVVVTEPAAGLGVGRERVDLPGPREQPQAAGPAGGAE